MHAIFMSVEYADPTNMDVLWEGDILQKPQKVVGAVTAGVEGRGGFFLGTSPLMQ